MVYMSYSLSSFNRDYIEDNLGDYYRGYEVGYQEFRLWLI